jgi:hypothetical protein
LAKEALPLIDQIESSVNAMDGLFGALLDVSRLDAGVVAVDRRAVAIRSILARVCTDCAPGAEAKGVRLDWVGCSAVVDSDPVLLERIVRNLVSNAVRYTDPGRVLGRLPPRWRRPHRAGLGHQRRHSRRRAGADFPGILSDRQCRTGQGEGPRPRACDRPPCSARS